MIQGTPILIRGVIDFFGFLLFARLLVRNSTYARTYVRTRHGRNYVYLQGCVPRERQREKDQTKD